jgi:hypothetical protein
MEVDRLIQTLITGFLIRWRFPVFACLAEHEFYVLVRVFHF